ncbi:MAG: hypothetical protein QOJ03_2857 [Frankiaceae bacterium]|nr:hypothetical protein [Frankiaceae bacterium]
MPGVFVVEVIVAAAVLVGVAFVVSRDLAGLDDAGTDAKDIGLPADRPMRSDDLPRLRFRAVSGLRGGLRGYRFDDVDAAMSRIEESMRAAEAKADQRAAGRVVRPPGQPSA